MGTSWGCAGCNIKLVCEAKSLVNVKYKRLYYNNTNKIVENMSYNQYLNLLTIKERKRKLRKNMRNTLLIFHSGSSLLSSPNAYYQEIAYNTLIKIIKEEYDDI